MRALITGVTGFAGGHLAEHLLAAGDHVCGTALSTDWPATSPRALAGSVPLVVWDVGGELAPAARALVEAFAPECIFHLAAISIPGKCGDDEPSPRARAVNVDALVRVVRLARELPGVPRVVFTSSSHVYAPVAKAAPRVDEDAPLGPRRAYGKTKLAAERAAAALASELGVELVTARSFQHTGPRQTGPMMLPEWLAQVSGGAATIEVQTRDARIDVSDVRDVVRAYRLLALRGRPGTIYNVGSGKSRTSGDVLDALLGRLDAPPEVRERHPGAKQDPIADVTRLRSETLWQPTIPIEQTVRDALSWWRTNPTRVANEVEPT